MLKDVRGRPIASVVAKPVADGAAAVSEKRTDADMETALTANLGVLSNLAGLTHPRHQAGEVVA